MKTTPKCTIAVLVAALILVFAVTSCTKTDPVTEPVSSESSEESDSSSEKESDDAAAVPIIGSSAGRDSSSSSSSSSSSDEEYSSVAEATSTVSVGGVVLRSQISGAYSVKGFEGFAVRMGADDIRGLAGITGTPFVRAYDITPKKSPSAFVSINAAAASVGATVLGAINVDLGQMAGGKFSSLPNTVAVPATIGVANADGRTLAVVKVLPGGAFEILQDSDEYPLTVTFPITGGLASYAVIAY